MIHHPPPRLVLRPRHRLLALASAAWLPLVGCVSSDPPLEGWNTEAVAVADLDVDGVPDVVSATAVYGEVDWLPGYLTVRRQTRTAPGSFDSPARTTTCLDPEALAVGDLDGDGRPDVAVACGATAGAGHEVAVHMGPGPQPLTFGAPTLLPTGTALPSAIRLADLDGDGRLDVIVGARTGTSLLVFLQAPAPAAAGTFAPGPPLLLATGAAPVAVAAGDLTGAGRLDLVVATDDGRVAVLLHDAAAGSFLPGLSYPAGLYPVAVEIADLDGDLHPDLLMADRNGSLLVMRQAATGGGAFEPVVAHDVHDWNTRALAVADLDGDGRLDVEVASAGPPGLPGSVAVFHQAPAPAAPGALLSPWLYTGYYGPLSIVAGDLNQDDLPDLVIADGLASIRFQELGGHFYPPVWLRQ